MKEQWDELKETIIELRDNNGTATQQEVCQFLANLMNVLEAQMEPARKRGKWKVCDILDYAQRPSGRKILRCPFCKYLTDEFRSKVDYYHKLTNFCPNCGADMRGESEDE